RIAFSPDHRERWLPHDIPVLVFGDLSAVRATRSSGVAAPACRARDRHRRSIPAGFQRDWDTVGELLLGRSVCSPAGMGNALDADGVQRLVGGDSPAVLDRDAGGAGEGDARVVVSVSRSNGENW